MTLQMLWDTELDQTCTFVAQGVDRLGLVAVEVAGLRWTVSALDPTTVVEVEVGIDASDFVRAAVEHLLGADAAEALIAGPGGGASVVTIADGAERSSRHLAMGLLAISATGSGTALARALDTAALLHDAGLDALPGVPLPGHDDLADDALDVLDALPIVIRELAGAEPPWSRAHDAVVRSFQSLSAFVRRSGVLTRDDEEATAAAFAEVVGELQDLMVDAALIEAGSEDDLLAAASGAARRTRPRFAGRDLLGADRGATTGTPRAVPVYLADPDVRGVAWTKADEEHDTLVVRLRVPGTPALPVLWARPVQVLADGECQAHTEVRLEQDPDHLDRLVARIQIPAGVDLDSVDVVRTTTYPLLSRPEAQHTHEDVWARELAHLRRIGWAAPPDDRPHAGDDADDVGQLLEDVIGLVPDATGATVVRHLRAVAGLPPTEALGLVSSELADRVVAEVENGPNPRARAARAADVAAFLDGPGVVLLRARVRLAEAKARRDLSEDDAALELASEADRLFRQVGDRDGMQEAERLLGELGAGG